MFGLRRSTLSARIATTCATALLLGAVHVLPAAADDDPPPPPPAPTVPAGTEIVERRDAFSRTFATDAPNTFRTEIHSRPIHFRDDQGQWQPIDPTLVPGVEGHVHSAANDMLVDIAPTTTGRLATVRFDDATSVGFGLTGAASMSPLVNGTTATFGNVLSGVTVTLDSMARGLKETITLASPLSPSTYVFPLSLENLSASIDDEGNVILRDRAGTERGRVPHGHMSDSKIDPHSGDGAMSDGVSYQLVSTGPTGTALKVTADPLWLASPARQYPVFVDPTVYTAGTDDTFVESPYTNDYSTDVLLKNGTFNGGANKARSFIHFAGANALDGKVINSATIQVYENWAFSCTASQVDLYEVAQSWTGSGLHSYPGFTLGTKIDSDISAHGYTGCADAWVTFTATTAMRNWASNAWVNNGVALRAPDELNDYQWKKWDSANTANDPKLTVDWSEPNRAPGQVSGRTVTPKSCATCSPTVTVDSTPVLTGTATDADADVLRYDFEVYPGWLTTVDSSGNATTSVARTTAGSVSGKASGTQGAWTVTPALADGKYSYRVRAYDGTAFGVWSSGWVQFTVDSTAPAAPTASSPTHPSASAWYTSDAPSFSWSATSESGVAGYSWVLDQAAGTVPDAISDGTATSYSYTSVPPGTWYLHVRALSNAGLWGATKTVTVNIDNVTPGVPGNVTSTSHVPNLLSTDPTIDMSWSLASDTPSGVAGYAYAFNSSQTTAAGTTASLANTATTVSSSTLSDGTWWFHVRAIDYAGNASNDVAVGPYLVNAAIPAAPVVTSSTHASSTWSSSRNVAFSWTQPSDVFGIAGYSVAWDHSPTISIPHVVTTTLRTDSRTNVADGVWYLHVAAVTNAGVWGATSDYLVKIDGTAPVISALTSASHADSNIWYANETLQLQTTASALSGITGFSYSVDHSPTGDPGLTITTSLPTATFSSLADGVWYAHVRSFSASGLVSPVQTLLVRIDKTLPTLPTLTSPDHNTTESTNQSTVTLDWGAAPGTDATSGIAGYSVTFNGSASTWADTTLDLVGTRTASLPLADGVWYAHVRALDRAGNIGPDAVLGPITIASSAAPVGTDSTNHFVELWSPRVTSDTFGVDYLATPGYSAAILAEGYHGMNPVQKAYLGASLWLSLSTATPLPAGVFSTEQVDALRQMVTDFVFNKDALAAALEQFGPTVDTVTRTAFDVAHVVPALLQAALDAVNTVYDGIDLPLPELPVETYDELLPDFDDLELDSPLDVVSDLSSDTTALLNQIDVGLDDPVTDVETELNRIVTAAGNAVDPAPVFNALPPLPVSADYQLCWESASSNGCRVSVLATPVPLDVSGDGTSDVLVTFGPTVDPANPAVVTMGYTVARFALAGDLTNKPIKAHVWVNYDIGALGKRFLFGFDGYRRGDSLAESTTATIGLPDTTKVSAGDLVLSYAITHTTAPAKWAFTAGMRNLTGNEDPRDASIQFAPPTNAHGRIEMVRQHDAQSGEDHESNDVTYTADAASRIDMLYNTKTIDTTTNKTYTTNTHLVLDKLPTQAHANIDRTETSSDKTLKISGETSDRMARVLYTSVSSDGTVATKLAVDVANTPKQVEFTLNKAENATDFSAAYKALSGETVDKVAGSYAKYSSNVLQQAFSGAATQFPPVANASYGPSAQSGDDKMLFSYSASAGVPFAAFTGYDRAKAITIAATATSLPTVVTGYSSAAQKHVEFSGSTPIGSLNVAASRNGGKILRLVPEHATLIANGTAFGADVRVTGLLGVSADYGDVVGGTADFAPGGQRFVLAGQVNTLAGSVDISNMPTHVEVSVDRPNLKAHFATSQPINKAIFYVAKRPGGPIVEGTLLNLPTLVDVTGSLGNVTTVSYRTNLPLGDARVMFSSDANPSDRTGITVRSHVQTVPTVVDATYDRTMREVHFSANAPVGLIEGTLSKSGAKAKTYAGDHVSFNGTSTAFAASARIHGLMSLDADYAGGIDDTTASLSVVPGGQSFVVNGALDNDRVYGRISNLPSTVSLTLHGLKDMTYDASSVITQLDGYKSNTVSGPTFQASVKNVPRHVHVTVDTTSPTYELHYDGTTGADLVKGYYSPRYVSQALNAATQFASGYVDHPPASATVTANTTAGTLTYRASAPATAVHLAVNRVFASNLVLDATARDIPAQFDVTRNADQVKFAAIDRPLGYVKFRAANTGTPANRSGNHLFVRTSKSAGTFNVSAQATDVSTLYYDKLAEGLTVTADVDLHGQPFAIDAQLDSPASNSSSATDEYRIAAKGTISALPSHVTFTRNGGTIHYDAASGLDVRNLDVSLGWIKALAPSVTPRPQARNGVSVTDGTCSGTGCSPTGTNGSAKGFCDIARNICKAVKVRVDYDGLGKGFDVDLDGTSKVIDVDPLSPSTHRLQALIDLDDIPTKDLYVDFDQAGIQPGTSLHFGPIWMDKVNGNLGIVAVMNNSAPMGALTLTAKSRKRSFDNGNTRFNNWSGTLTMSNVPASVDLTVASGGDTSADLVLSQAISSIKVNASAQVNKKQSDGTYAKEDPRATASIVMSDVPAGTSADHVSFVLNSRKISADNNRDLTLLPGFHYNAPAGTLDLGVTVSPRLQPFTLGNVGSFVLDGINAGFTDLGKDVDITYTAGSRPVIEASSAGSRTGEIHFRMGFGVDVLLDKSPRTYWPDPPNDWVRVDVKAHVDAHLAAPSVNLTLKDFADATVRVGDKYLAYGVEGDYATLDIETPGLHLDSDSSVEVTAKLYPYWSWMGNLFKDKLVLKGSFNGIYGHISKKDASGDTGLCVSIRVGLQSGSGKIYTRPAPTPVDARQHNGVTIHGSDGAQVFTFMDPYDPDYRPPMDGRIPGLIDVIAAQVSDPYNNGRLYSPPSSWRFGSSC